MNHDVVIEEVRRVLTPLLDDGPVNLVFRHDYEPKEGDQRYTCDGFPPLAFCISPSQSGEPPNVYITRIGNHEAVDALPTRPVPDSDGLPDDIWVPDDPFRADYTANLPRSAQHYGLYTHICRELTPASILEIGARGGYSAWAMLQSVPQATYVGIDLNKGTWGGQVGYVHRAKAMLHRLYPEAQIDIVEGDSQGLTELPCSFDVIHIDGDHSYAGALHDLELCLPYAKHIIIDDVGFSSTVRAAVCEFLAQHPEVTAVRYDSWRGLVLMDVRGAAKKRGGWPDFSGFDDVRTVAEARELILQNDGIETDIRWDVETAWLLDRLVFPPGLLLDIGCGIGRLSGPLARRGDHIVLGIDTSATMRRMAISEVNEPDRFAVATQSYLAKLVASGLRAQGALAIWVLQHLPAGELEKLVPLLWQALEPGAVMFTLDIHRCIPYSDGVARWWHNDDYDVCGLLEREGFMLHMTEKPPLDVHTGNPSLRRWIRRR